MHIPESFDITYIWEIIFGLVVVEETLVDGSVVIWAIGIDRR